MATLAFVLLIAALLLFLLSTRQWALYIRALVWGGGVVLLILAAVIVARNEDNGGVLRAFGDFAAHWNNPGESALAQALSRNGPYIARFVLPLLDLFLIIGAILGILAVVAFTPGEGIERATRPLAIGLVGAILGGVLALTIVGTGFGNVAEQRVYSTYMEADRITDGDTFFVGQVSVRLAGIDAPQQDQICRQVPRTRNISACGAEATRHLQQMIGGALVTCIVEENDKGEPMRSDETFARPLVKCEAARPGRPAFDIGERMVEDGHAIEYRNRPGEYAGAALVAREMRRGLHGLCTLRPDIWRDNQRIMAAFRDNAQIPRDAAHRLGPCPPPAAPQRPGREVVPE
jgi:endonuclease YncB( thermonuclease family)